MLIPLTIMRSFVANRFAAHTEAMFGTLRNCLSLGHTLEVAPRSVLLAMLGERKEIAILRTILPSCEGVSSDAEVADGLHLHVWSTNIDIEQAVLLYRMLSGLHTMSVWVIIRDDHAAYLTQEDRCRLGGALS